MFIQTNGENGDEEMTLKKKRITSKYWDFQYPFPDTDSDSIKRYFQDISISLKALTSRQFYEYFTLPNTSQATKKVKDFLCH